MLIMLLFIHSPDGLCCINVPPLGVLYCNVSCSPVGAIFYSIGQWPMNNANIFPNGSPVGAELYIPIVIFDVICIE